MLVDIRNELNMECVCPDCGVIYSRFVPLAHYDNPFAWHRAGYLVILCKDCEKIYENIRRKLLLEDMWYRTVDGRVYGE